MSKKPWFLPVLVLLAVTLACASGTPTAQKVGEVIQNEGKSTVAAEKSVEVSPVEPTAKPKATQPSTFKVGDIVETENLRIILTSAAYSNGLIKANFSIENIGKDETTISSIMSFSAKDTEGTKLEQEIFDCGSSLDGKVLASDRLRGDACWKLASPVKFKLYFQNDLFSSGALVWELDANELPQTLADVEVKPFDNQGSNVKSNAVMEPVKSDKETITLTSAAYSNGKLMANFFIENTGKEETSVSSMMSFYVKDSAGSKLEQEMMDCGPGLDGKVLAGDHMKGDICWKLPQADKVKVYYESSMFSTGAVVWELDAGKLPPALEQVSISPTTSLLAKTFQPGEVVILEKQTVTLNEAKIQGNVLKANFTVENKGTEEINISSLLSFYARNPEGTKLEVDIFNCGSQMDGKVLAGDKLKGDVCWKTAGATAATLYYEDELFGVGAVVWNVK